MARLARSPAGHAAAAALLSGLAGGCAHSSAFRCPAEGGPPWVEVESDRFVVKTDASEAVAERAVRELERMRMAQLGAWDGRLDPPARLEVVVLRNPTELDEVVGSTPRASFTRVAGYYVPGARPRVVTGLLIDREATSLVLPWFQRDREESASALESSILAHELAHHLVSQVLLRQPPWLGEGLAQYLEVTKIGTWQGRPAAAVGMASWDAWAAERIPVRDVFAWRRGAPGYYASSWLLVHWLVNRRGAAFAAYQQRLARAEDPADAWKAEFPHLDPADAGAMASLDRELDDYLRSRAYTPLRVLLPVLETRLRQRRMPPPEVHTLRAELFLYSMLPRGKALPRADAEIAASLREDPSGLSLALILGAAGHGEQALALGRSAAAAHPGDWRGWALLAAGAEGREELAAERLAALRRAAALVPDDAWALNDVAWGLHQAGASGEAFPLAARAARLAPASASVLDTWAAILADVGRCPEALLAQRRAVDLLGDRVAGPPAREIRDRLVQVEARCRAAAPPPP